MLLHPQHLDGTSWWRPLRPHNLSMPGPKWQPPPTSQEEEEAQGQQRKTLFHRCLKESKLNERDGIRHAEHPEEWNVKEEAQKKKTNPGIPFGINECSPIFKDQDLIQK